MKNSRFIIMLERFALETVIDPRDFRNGMPQHTEGVQDSQDENVKLGQAVQTRNGRHFAVRGYVLLHSGGSAEDTKRGLCTL